MPNPQLTGGAGFEGLGFLETNHFTEFLQLTWGKGRRVVSLYKEKRSGNKSSEIHQRSMRNPSDDIRDPQWKIWTGFHFDSLRPPILFGRPLQALGRYHTQ